MLRIPAILLSAVLAVPILSLAADPAGEISSFSSIKKVTIGELSSGNILSERGTTGHFDRGISVQTCYLVRRPVDETADLLAHWNPINHPELEIYESQLFESSADSGLDQLRLDPSIEPVQKLLEQTKRGIEDTPASNLATFELKLLREMAKAEQAEDMDPDSPAFCKFAGKFWAALLKQRVEVFEKGGITALPPYEMEDESIPIHGELLTLVAEEPTVKARFDQFLREVLVHLPSATPPKPASYYWQLVNSEKEATYCLGAIYTQKIGDNKWQVADYQLYSSRSYLTMITLYELWAVQDGGTDCTVVWRQDFVSSNSFASLRGIEQMAAGALMTKSIKNNIRVFQEDAAKPIHLQNSAQAAPPKIVASP